MGESTPDAIELECPGCSARFRLRPTKGRLPKGPINCPECATPFDIPAKYQADNAPQAQVLRSSKSGPKELPDEQELRELGDDNTAEVNIGKTMMGRPIAVDFDNPKASEKTRAATVQPVAKANESGESIPDDVDGNPDDLRQTSERERVGTPLPDQNELEETSESVFNNTTKAPWDKDSTSQDSAVEDSEVPQSGANIRKTRPNLAVGKGSQKPKLAELLKKVREKKAEGGPLLTPPTRSKKTSLADGLDNLFDETANELNLESEGEDQKATNPNAGKEMDALRDAIAPGMASETRGSGYIRIPTAEIMDVLGQGNYRLRVDDVVYEPVDEKGLARLIKGGVLMGAEQIAEQDGDWMPVADHPVVQRLRRKMADQAHLMLAEVAAAAPSPPEDDPPTEDLDLDELMSEEVLEEPSEAPPPIPAASQSSDTIETGPPSEMTLPGRGDVDPDHLPDVGEVSELMANAQADDPFAPDYQAAPKRHAASEASAPAQEPSDVVPPVQSMPDAPKPVAASHDSPIDDSFPAVTQEQAADDGAGAPIAREYPDPEELDSPRSSTRTGLIVTLLGFVFMVGVIVVAYMSGALDPFIGTDSTSVTEPDQPREDPLAVAEPDAEADKPPEPEPDPLEEARAAWEGEASAANALTYANLLLEGKKYDDARRVIVSSESNEELETLFNQTLTDQFADERPVELSSADLDGATPVKLRKRSILLFEHEGQRARFIPDTGAAIPAFRASIASYRLCQAALCGFWIPRAIPARITADEWAKASEALEGSVKTEMTTLESGEFLMGAIQYEVDTDAFFPTYETSIWRDWLDGDKSGLDEDLSSALEPVKGISQEAYDNLVAATKEASTRDFASQTASILAFDYLTNNFARFDRASTEYDHGIMVKDGDFYSVDNLDTWRPRASTRVKGRFSWTRRFNKKSVESLRSLDRETLSPLLFSNPTSAEKTALRVFWSQRDKLLDRVDSLVKSNGEEDVYFE